MSEFERRDGSVDGATPERQSATQEAHGAPVQNGLLMRKIQRRAIQRKADGGGPLAVAPAIPTAGGEPLPGPVQHKMEGALGADFSSVRVQSGSHVTELGAQAFTQGNDVHFAPGKYEPHSPAGQELLGHELQHVKQQREGRVAPTVQGRGLAVNDDLGLEREADEAGARAARGESAPTGNQGGGGASSGATVQRKADDAVAQFKLKLTAGYTEAVSWGAEAKALMAAYDEFEALVQRAQTLRTDGRYGGRLVTAGERNALKAAHEPAKALKAQIDAAQPIPNDYAKRVEWTGKLHAATEKLKPPTDAVAVKLGMAAPAPRAPDGPGRMEQATETVVGATAVAGQVADIGGALVETGDAAGHLAGVASAVGLGGHVTETALQGLAGADAVAEGLGGGIGGIKDTVEGARAFGQGRRVEGAMGMLSGGTALGSLGATVAFNAPGVGDALAMASGGAKAVGGVSKLANARANKATITALRSEAAALPNFLKALDDLEGNTGYYEGAKQTVQGTVEGASAALPAVGKYAGMAASKGYDALEFGLGTALPYAARAIGSTVAPSMVDSNAKKSAEAEQEKERAQETLKQAVVEAKAQPDLVAKLHQLVKRVAPDDLLVVDVAIATLSNAAAIKAAIAALS